MRVRFILIFVFIGILKAFASVPIVNLNDGWLVFDNSYKSFVPYIPSQETPKVLYYSFKPGKFNGDTLQFNSHKGLCLYFDYRLVYQNTNQGEILIKIPINKLVSSISADSVILAFYKENGIYVNRLKAQIITRGKIISKQSMANPLHFLSAKIRKKNSWNDVLLFSVIAVLLLLIVSKMLFPEEISFLQLVGMNSNKVISASGFLSGMLIVKIIINSICISTFIYFILHFEGEQTKNILGIYSQAEGANVSYWYIMSCVIFVHILKFTYNYFCASFSHMTQLLQSQNFMFVNIFYLVNLMLLAILIASNLSPSASKWIIGHSIQIIVIYLVIPIFFLIINIIKLSVLRNVYLFSYICTAEILPLLVALKFLT